MALSAAMASKGSIGSSSSQPSSSTIRKGSHPAMLDRARALASGKGTTAMGNSNVSAASGGPTAAGSDESGAGRPTNWRIRDSLKSIQGGRITKMRGSAGSLVRSSSESSGGASTPASPGISAISAVPNRARSRPQHRSQGPSPAETTTTKTPRNPAMSPVSPSFRAAAPTATTTAPSESEPAPSSSDRKSSSTSTSGSAACTCTCVAASSSSSSILSPQLHSPRSPSPIPSSATSPPLVSHRRHLSSAARSLATEASSSPPPPPPPTLPLPLQLPPPPSSAALLTPSTSASSSASISASSSANTTPPPTATSRLEALGLHSYTPNLPESQDRDKDPDAMAVDDDAPVLTFWGPDPVPLPQRFARIKRNLIAGHESALEASWTRLIHALRDEISHIEGLGSHLIPSIEFSDMDNSAQTARFGRDLRRYGVGVVRRTVHKQDTEDMVNATIDYLDSKRTNNPTPLKQDPACYDYYWTPAQVRARAHPSVLKAQRFMMGLWETNPKDPLATRLPITYVDRIRIHGAEGEPRLPLEKVLATNGSNGDSSKGTNGIANTGDITSSLEHHQSPPQSADDWINALQSSAGIIAQVDNGSLERWEPDGYGHAGTYSRVFQGDWESYDPWECASRVSSTLDLYNGYGACTIFRMFQGIFALSTIESGMVRLLPSPRLATAYYLLRPFFSPKTPAPEIRSGPEWEAYLDPTNWRLERDPDTIIHGAVPGHAQRITETWHPHLHLRGSMITFPTLQPGDYIFWHPDLPYHISSSNPGLQTPHQNDDKVSMLLYLPAAPLTQTNALYLARQRKAFQRGQPGPDFVSSSRGSMVEDPDTRPGEKEIARVGGSSGLQAMGLAPWESEEGHVTQEANGDQTVRGDKTVTDTSPCSHAEAGLVKLSNLILFPDIAMTGC